MAIHLRSSKEDVHSFRFGVSPIGECVYSFRYLSQGARSGVFAQSARPRLAGFHPRLLPALMPPRGYLPDAFTPSPGFGSFLSDELERMRDTDPSEFSEQVAWMEQDPLTSSEWKRATRKYRDFAVTAPENALGVIANEIQCYFTAVLEPEWRGIRDALLSDIAEHHRVSDVVGSFGMLSTISDEVSWGQGTLSIESRYELVADVQGQGITFVPSMFTVAQPLAMIPPCEPMVVYRSSAGRNRGAKPPVREAGLAGIVGHGRLRVLMALQTPAHTGDLAIALGVTPAAISQHVTVLRKNGLATTRREGRHATHSITTAGLQLLSLGR